MLPTTSPQAVAARDLPAFAHAEAYVHYFDRLADAPAPRASLRRLLSHLDADLHGTERVGLWWALWRCARRLEPDELQRIGECLDGRHAARLARLRAPWDAPSLIEQLANDALDAQGQAEFVPALLEHHRLQPLADPDAHAPTLVMLAVRAELAAATGRLDAPQIAQLVAAANSAADRDPSLSAQALAALFDLALHARDETTAVAALAELLRHGQGGVLVRDRVRAWLDGCASLDADDPTALPLTLAVRWQQQWLQPVAWNRRAMLASIAGALQRRAPRQRLLRLMQALEMELPATDFEPRAPALKALRALDSAYDLIERGCDAAAALQRMMGPDSLAPPALAAVHRGSARQLALAGALEDQALALARARLVHPSAPVRDALAALLPRLGAADVPSLGPDWRSEEPFWKAAVRDGSGALQRLAAFHLARLWTSGALEPRTLQKCQHLEAARALWQWLLPHAAYAADAQAALGGHELRVLLPALRRHAGVEHLWIEHAGARRLTIVFSCVFSHHTYPEVQRLRSQLPGQHLLFVRNPEKNWYSDAAFDELTMLVRERVLPHFDPAAVTCYYGSMGGHGALKVALEFGFRAVVFNPQTDLDLWASFRSDERPLLWGAERHARLSQWPVTAWERVSLYYACGSASPDREALSAVVEWLRQCRRATVVIEKFADPHHPGLMHRAAEGPVGRMLEQIGTRLDTLCADAPAAGATALDGADAAAFWDRLDAARALKVEIQVRDGRLWWQPSLLCGTRVD